MPAQEIVNLALRRSLFYPAAEIYPNAPSGFFDFGPDGETIRRKVIDFWRNEFVEREGFVEVYGAQILPEDVFKASGHLDNFNDPIVQCEKCHGFYRADRLIEDVTGKSVPESAPLKDFDKIIVKQKIGCPKCSGSLGKVKSFNMMMRVDIGAMGDKLSYLRPETCQTIFLNFDRILKTMRQNLPFGIAQAGCSFRNEIAPRNTLLRERELGQMEVEVFFNPHKINEIEDWDEVKSYKLNLFLLKQKKVTKVSCQKAVKDKIVSGRLVAYYLARVQQLYEKYGIPVANMRFRQLHKDEKAFYAKETWDFEVETDLGWLELIACNHRSDYDLTQHAKFSKKDLSVKEDGKSFYPNVFEISIGLDRTFYAVVDYAFRKDLRGEEERVYLSLNPRLAPYTVAIFPLVKKGGLAEKAKELFDTLTSYRIDTFYDAKGSIGKRYARVDEIGVPYVITVDFDTLKKKTVTLRERDSMKQKRVKIDKLPELLWHLELEKTSFEKI
jgi:glycyl-tRNA synthetase